jgi:cytochrome P450
MRVPTAEPRPAVQKLLPAGDWLAGLEETFREHGDVAPMRRRNTWLLSHPDAIRDVLVTHDKRFRKSPVLRRARWTLGNGLLTSEGEFNRKQRGLISPSLHTKRLAGYADTMVRYAAEATDGWREGAVIGTHREMMRLTLSIVAEVLFGAAVGPEVDRISEAMDLNVRMFRRVSLPWGFLRAILPTPFNIKYLFARTVVFLPQWIVHRDPRWWPEPERFDPERFTEPAAKARPKWAYFPFGCGSRACVGEAFAWTEAVLVLATIARKWRLESVDAGEPELEPGITLRPKGEIRMVVRGRQA